MKLTSGLFAAALLIGLGAVSTPTYAEEGAAGADAATAPSEAAPKDKSKLQELEEDVMKDLEANKDQPADSIMQSEGADD